MSITPDTPPFGPQRARLYMRCKSAKEAMWILREVEKKLNHTITDTRVDIDLTTVESSPPLSRDAVAECELQSLAGAALDRQAAEAVRPAEPPHHDVLRKEHWRTRYSARRRILSAVKGMLAKGYKLTAEVLLEYLEKKGKGG